MSQSSGPPPQDGPPQGGAPQYGAPQYGPPQYGPPQGGPPQYGGSQYGPPVVPSKRGPLVLVIVLGVVLVAVLAVGAVVLFRADDSDAGKAEEGKRAAAPEAVQFRAVLKAEPGGCTASTSPAPDGTACGADGVRYTLGEVALDGNRVSEVKAAQSAGSWIVGLTLDDEGTQKFGRLTSELATKTPPQNQLAIVVRGRVVTAPTVMSAITGGKVEISSNFTQQSAEQLAKEITG